MKANSPYLSSIVQHFMSIDASANHQTIKRLLGHDTSHDDASAEELTLALKHWLLCSINTSSEVSILQDFLHTSKKGKEQSFLLYTGNEGKREAVFTMLKLAAKFQPPLEMWCFMNDTRNWFTEDPDYAAKWEAANYTFLNSGNTIRIVISLDRQYKVMAESLISWLPFYLTGRVFPYYISTDHLNDWKSSIILLKDKLLLISNPNDTGSINFDTLLFTNPVVLNNYNNYLKNVFENSIPLFSSYSFKDCKDYADLLSNMVNIDEQQYVIMRFPFVNDLGLDEIQEVLEDNNVPSERIGRILNACSALKKDTLKSDGNFFRYLILQNQLKKLLAQDKIMLDTLSFFSGQPVYISNGYFRNLLRKISRSLVEGKTDYEIAFIDDIYERHLNNLNIFVKKNSCISVFLSPDPSKSKEPVILTSNEPSVILSLFMYCNRLWLSKQPQKRSAEYVSNKLHILAETIFPEERK